MVHGEGRDATCRRRDSHSVTRGPLRFRNQGEGPLRFRNQGEKVRKHHFVSDFGPRNSHDE